MDIFDNIRTQVIRVLEILQNEELLSKNLDFTSVNAQPPKDINHGDVATNAAMVVAKKSGMNPRNLAILIIEKMKNNKFVEDLQIAGPGFINMRFKKSILLNQIYIINKLGKDYGNLDIGKNKKINIEYVSANPTGPMHIGHARGAVYGDALALLLLKAGYDVTKEYYVNDAGSQISTLAKSVFLRYKEALGIDIGEIGLGLYPGDYLKIVGESLKAKYADELINIPENESLQIVRNFAVDAMLTLIKNDLAQLGIYHDVFVSEADIENRKLVEEALAILKNKGLIYQGVLEPPKEKKQNDWEEREQTLFKSTEFGDDLDRPIKKSDGSWTYFASDCAYHLDKIKRGFNNMVIILGADHGGYVKRLQSAVTALSDGQAKIDAKICQLVNFMENGQPIKMSKRAGTFTTVNDVVNELGKDVIRFMMLTRKNDAVMDFDLDLAKESSKDNPIFYVQYAHARAKSVIRTAKEIVPPALELLQDINMNLLNNLDLPEEMLLIKTMSLWPSVVSSAAISYEPHRVAFYLQELAAVFHSLWNKGKEKEILRFILKDNIELTAARLSMINAFANVIESGLFIFNINPLEEM